MGALSIKISGDPATFHPPVQHADAGDVISWSNKTKQLHQIVQTGTDGTPLPFPIGADWWAAIEPEDESPAWTVPPSPSGTKITYKCVRHGETGTIVVN
jgi:plastocyanin